MAELSLEQLMESHTEAGLVEDASKRPSVPVGIYDAKLTFSKAVTEEAREDGSGFPDRPLMLWKVQLTQDDRTYNALERLCPVDWRQDRETQAIVKRGEPGYGQLKQNRATKLWGQLLKMFDAKNTLPVKEQVETISEMDVQAGVAGIYSNDAGEEAFAFDEKKVEELTGKGFYLKNSYISFFREKK